MARINDVVLIYFEEQPVHFARIEEILPDAKRGWYHVKLLLLQIPLRSVTWILREAYIDGEGFTMGGNRMRLEVVACPDAGRPGAGLELSEAQAAEKAPPAGKVAGGNVISLSDIRKKQ